MTQLLEGKTAIIYGGGGNIGSFVGRTFAREGATVFLVGRTPSTVQAAAEGITAEGGRAHAATLDTLDEQAVEQHVGAVVDQTGGIDVSFNLTSRGDMQGTRLRKRPTLQEVADTAAFLASDSGSGITASIVNVSSGITAH
jgi:NADP-dependent 3-hydroxy acid dehydrogenase YdfG